MQTRGERNNNPGNIREYRDEIQWQGERATDDDPAFEEFKTPEYGIRALGKLLLNYQRGGYDTVRKIINRYAPTNENDTAAYINAVCKHTGYQPDEKIDLFDFRRLYVFACAIIQHENGRNIYTLSQLTTGIRMALS